MVEEDRRPECCPACGRTMLPAEEGTLTGEEWTILGAFWAEQGERGGAPMERGKVTAHITPEFQKKWLLDRAEKHGFLIKRVDVTGRKWLQFRKHGLGRPVTLLSVTYEGVLEVTDPVLFRETLTAGIGRGKAYGQGLLTVARAGERHG